MYYSTNSRSSSPHHHVCGTSGLANFAKLEKDPWGGEGDGVTVAEVLCTTFEGGTEAYFSPEQAKMWKNEAGAPGFSRQLTPATSDLWQASVTVLELFGRFPPMAPELDHAEAVYRCVNRKSQDVVLAMSPTQVERWIVDNLAFPKASGIAARNIDGLRMLELARGGLKPILNATGLKTGSGKMLQMVIQRNVSTEVDAVPPLHDVTDISGATRQCGVGLLLLRSLNANNAKRPASAREALEVLGAQAKPNNFDISSAAGFRALPPLLATVSSGSHEDNDIEVTYSGLVFLFENDGRLALALTSCANWLAVISPENTGARARALEAFCALWRRHADHFTELALSPRAHWRVENFDAECFRQIALAMRSSGRSPRSLTSIDLSYQRFLGANVLEMLLHDDGVASLFTLNLASCQIPGVVPLTGLSCCSRLRELNLNGCRLTGG